MLEEVPTSGPRKRYNRTRTGCVTCRIRKIKCDESRPACVKCTSTGRKCDGYQTSLNIDRSAIPKVMMIVTDLERAACDESTGYALRFFYERSAPALTNYSSDQFWSRIVLQACLLEPSIRDLAIAAGCLERSMRHPSFLASSTEEQVYRFHYGRALKQLSGHNDVGVVLIGCLLLVLCEDMQANTYGALMHINAGRRLLMQNVDKIDSQLLTDLGAIFRSLIMHSPELAAEIIRIQFLLGGGRRASPHLPYLAGGKDLHSGFHNIDQAAAALYSLREPCVQVRQHPSPLTRFHSIPGVTARLNDWLETFNIFIFFMSSEQQTSNRIMIDTLRIYHSVLHISSRCASHGEEVVWDIHAHNFDGLAKSLSILSDLGGPGIQSLLFFVSCKYRDVAGRRRCIELLRYQIYGAAGKFLADVAEQVADMEELGIENPITSSDIPKFSRVRPHKIVRRTEFADQDVLVVRRSPFTERTRLGTATLPVTNDASVAGYDLEWKNRTLQRAIDLRIDQDI